MQKGCRKVAEMFCILSYLFYLCTKLILITNIKGMIFDLTIKAHELDDYLMDDQSQAEPIKLKVEVDSYGPDPEVGVMSSVSITEGWDWDQTPIPEFDTAIDSYFEINGCEVAENLVAGYKDWVEGMKENEREARREERLMGL